MFACLIVLLLFASCQSYKKVSYLQDVEVVEQTVQLENLYDAKIMPKDLLAIVVSCASPELAVFLIQQNCWSVTTWRKPLKH